MKRNVISKIISTLLATTLVFSLAGCGNQESNAPQSSASESSKAEASSDAAPATSEAEPVEEELTYPLDTDVELTFWAAKGPDALAADYKDYTESPFHMGLQEKTGVNIVYEFPDISAGRAQAYNLMMTDEVLPDIICYGIKQGDASLLIDEGIVWDLTEYIPKYAPDYWAYLNKPGNEVLLKSVMDDNGRHFGVTSFVEGFYNKVYIGPVIRQDWLDECGLDAPVTMDDWEKVLIAFKDKYDAKFGFTLDRFFCGLASGTGAMAAFWYDEYVDENGKIQCANVQPEWKESLEYMNRWYEMGLLDPDSFTMKDAGVRSKALNNEIGVSFTAMSQLTNFVADAEAEGSGAVWAGIEYPREAAGVPTSYVMAGNLASGQYSMITKECTEEEMIVALKWLNYGFTEEGILYENYGTEGLSYTYDADGQIVFTELITEDEDGLNEATKKYTLCASAPYSGIQTTRLVQLKNSQESVDAVYKWIENTDVGKHLIPSIALSSDETLEYNDKLTNIKSYIQQMAMKFVIGEEDLENFDEYVKTVEEMGLQELLDIKQAAYDRFMAR